MAAEEQAELSDMPSPRLCYGDCGTVLPETGKGETCGECLDTARMKDRQQEHGRRY